MPVHDWTRVDAGVFHDFHQRWIQEIKRALNQGLPTNSYYALAEQHSGTYKPDVRALKSRTPDPSVYRGNGFDDRTSGENATSGILVAGPKSRIRVETDLEFYRRKQNVVFVGCSPGKNPNESIVEMAVAKQAKVLIACDILDCKDLPWPFIQADGRDLPFDDDYTDMVLANAVIEHVGGLSDQLEFVAEQSRVARTWVITTPNRWFPVEAHTSVLFLHWSRKWRQDKDLAWAENAVFIWLPVGWVPRLRDSNGPIRCNIQLLPGVQYVEQQKGFHTH